MENNKNKYFLIGAITATVAALAGVAFALSRFKKKIVISVDTTDECAFDVPKDCAMCEENKECDIAASAE